MNTDVNNPNTQKYYIYARKSTDVEDKQVQSIEGQLDELRLLAKRENLEVIEELIEKKSAKIPGRPIFNKMLDSIEKGKANGILSWHPDRLARNSVDGGRIIYLIDTNKISALKFNTFWFEPTPQGKFMLSISFSQSKYYIDSLGENTRRGLRQKARNGNFPGVAPLGYLNDTRNRTIVVNKKIAPVIVEAYEMYSKGETTLGNISFFLKTKGITTSTGKSKHVSEAKKILSNPFYIGLFKWSGEVYEGRHEKVISKILFDKVQEMLKIKTSPWLKPQRVEVVKPFLGLLKCGECGMGITGDIKYKHYKNGKIASFKYYHCTKKSRFTKCNQHGGVREEDIHSQLTTILQKYTLRKDWASQMLLKLKQEESDISQSCLDVISVKRKDLEQIDIKLKLLLDSYLDQIIDKDDFQEKKFELMSKRKTIEEQILSLKKNQGNWIEPMRTWINEAQTVAQVAKSHDLQLKKALAVKVFGSNLFLENKIVRGDGQMSWSSLRSATTGRTWVLRVGIEPT
ncbi:MAG: recombinase family protein [bacterium]|nr:recombinase family protein [bacterium]